MRFPAMEMRDTMQILRRTGESAYGPILDDAVDVRAYVEPSSRAVRRPGQGEEVVCSLVAFVQAGTVVESGDQAVYEGKQYEVVLVDSFRPKGHESHREVYMRSVGTSDQ